jgi:glycosyltransferase involved in cell wall biosynthesis
MAGAARRPAALRAWERLLRSRNVDARAATRSTLTDPETRMPGRRSLLYLAREFPLPISTPARLRTFNWILHLAGRFDVTLAAPDGRVRADEPGLEVLLARSQRLLLPSPSSRRGAALRWAGRALAAAADRGGPAVMRQKLQIEAIRTAVRTDLQRRHFDVVFAEHWAWRDLVFEPAPLSVVDVEPWGDPVGHHRVPGTDAAGQSALSPGGPDDGREESAPVPADPSEGSPPHSLRARLRRRLRALESEVLVRADLVLVPNRAAREEVVRTTGGRTLPMVVPAGLDVGYFAAPRGHFQSRNVVFFTGLDRPTQRDALLYLHRSLLPRVRRRVGEVTLSVVSTEPAPDLESALQSDPHVRFVRPGLDPRSELGRGAVAVMPARFGPGWPDRLAQLLAMGIPTVATPVAARGLEVASGDGVLIATGASDFSPAITQVLLDPSLRSDLARRARETAETRLSLEATYGRVTEILARASDSLAGRTRD